MFKLLAKKVYRNKLVADMVIEDPSEKKNRTKKIFDAIEAVCHEFDLSAPIWLDSNIDEFKRTSRTRFYSDNFFDEIDFDHLEISVMEED